MLTFGKRIEIALPIQLIAVLIYGVCLILYSGCKKENITGSHIRAFLTDIRNDTTNIRYTDGYRTDSSYTSADTVSFSVFTSDSSIGLSSPEWRDALPRYYSSGGDTLVVSPYLGGIPEQLTTTWVNGVGLISVNYSYGGHVSTSTKLILREFTKP